MRFSSLKFFLAILTSLLIVGEAAAQLQNPLEKLWAGEAWFQEQPEAIGNFDDNMHFLSMFWDSDPIDTPGSPHFKAYYIGGPGFSTRLARSFDGINFTDAGTVVPIGSAGEWDDRIASFSSVWKDAGTYYLVYEGAGNDPMWPGDLGLATSVDGVNFTKQGRILEHLGGTFEAANIGTPSLYKEDDTWYMYYHGFDGTDVQVGLATGTDLTNLTRVQATPIIPTSATGWDSGTVGKRSRLLKEGDYYYMAYEGSTDKPFGTASWSTGMARSTDLINWDRLPVNPVLPGTVSGFGYDGPEMLFVDDELYIYYRKGPNQTVRAKLVSSDVSNSRFETGDFTDWGFVSMDGVVSDNGPSAPGSFAASMTITNPQSFEQAVAKSIAVTPGDLLNFSFDYKTLPGATGDFYVQLRYWDGVGENGFSDGGGGVFRGEYNVTLSPTDGAWLTTTLTDLPYVDGTNTADYVDIRVIANAFGAFEGTALVDNFNLFISAEETVAGDGNGDGIVDGLDYLIWAGAFGDDPAMDPPGSPENGDYNDDGVVDGLDYIVWASNFGAGTAVAVPESLSLSLLALGCAAIVTARPRKRRRQAAR